MSRLSLFTLVILSTLALSLAQGVDNKDPHQLRPNAVYSDCGGIIKIANTGNATIQYKAEGNYGMDERCIWTIVPESGVAVHNLVFLIESQDVEAGRDGLVLYTWNGPNALEARKIVQSDTGTIITLPVDRAFLYFSSDVSVSGSGFKVTVLPVTGGTATNPTAYFYKGEHCTTNIFYPPFADTVYANNVKVSFVLQPTSVRGASTTLEFPFLSTQTNSDFLEVYELPPYANDLNFALIGSYSGTQDGIATGQFKHPLLLIFFSDGSGSLRGFEINWSTTDETKSC